jgi:hypothetical protein
MFNFFEITATDILTSDPIDIEIGSNKLVNPIYGEAFGQALMVFTEEEQFNINSGRDPLTPATVRADRVGTYTSSRNCLPITMGNKIYFMETFGGFQSLLAYEYKDINISPEAVNVSSHADGYLKEPIHKLLHISNKGVILMVTESGLYLYRELIAGNTVLQQSFSSQIFGPIVDAVVVDNVVYLLTSSGITKWDVLSRTQDTQLDTRAPADKWYEYGNTQWAVEFPYDATEDIVLLIDDSFIIDDITLNPSDHSVGYTDYDLSSAQVVECGTLIDSLAVLSKYYLRDRYGNARISGRTVINSLDLSVDGAGSFKVSVGASDRPVNESYFSPIEVSKDYVGLTDKRNLHKFKIGIRGDSATTDIVLTSDSVYRLAFIEFTREGVYYK